MTPAKNEVPAGPTKVGTSEVALNTFELPLAAIAGAVAITEASSGAPSPLGSSHSATWYGVPEKALPSTTRISAIHSPPGSTTKWLSQM